MQNSDVQSVLEDLATANIDAIHAYNRALANISDTVIHSRLTEFLGEHRKHVTELTREIRSQGGTPPEMVKGVKGRIVDAVTALHHTAAGLKGVFQALKTADARVAVLYGKAVPKIDRSPLRDLLRKHLSSINNHLEYIKNNLQAL